MREIKILIVLTFMFGITSCKKHFESDKYDVNLENMFKIFGDDLDKDYNTLKIEINNKELKLKDSISQYDKYKENTFDYLKYLDELDSLCLISQSNLFFEKGRQKKEANLFILKTENYIQAISLFLTDNYIKERVHVLIGLDDVQNDEGIYFRYLDYYYNGVTQNTFHYLIKNRKRNVLIIQNEILNGILLNNCQERW